MTLGAQRLAQATDVDVDRALADGHVVAPRLGQQGRPRHHPARAAQERHQQIELDARQLRKFLDYNEDLQTTGDLFGFQRDGKRRISPGG